MKQACAGSRHTRNPGVGGARGRRQPDFSTWSVEELRAFAAQMRLPDAMNKTRRELLTIFNATSRS